MLPEAKQLATVVVCEDDEATLELLCDHLTADHDRVRGLLEVAADYVVQAVVLCGCIEHSA